MRFSSLFIVLCSTLFVVSCAHKKMGVDEGAKQTKETTAKEKSKALADKGEAYTCLVAGDKRIVTLEKENKKCEVHYTKFGKKEQMAWGQSNLKICADVYTNIRTNIEKNGFKCTTGLDSPKKERKTASTH